MKRVRAAVLAESSSWRTRMCEISVTSMPVLFPVSRRASFASPQEAAKAAGRRDHPDLLRLLLAVGRAVHQPGPTQAAAVELRDLSAALLGLAIIAHPPMWLVLVLFCVFGIAMYSGQCLEAIYPSELFPTGVRATANGFATGASRIGAAIGVCGAPHLLNYSVQLTMLVGAGVAGLGWLVTMLLAPETNGKLLTESSAVSQPSTVRTVKSAVAADGAAGAAR